MRCPSHLICTSSHISTDCNPLHLDSQLWPFLDIQWLATRADSPDDWHSTYPTHKITPIRDMPQQFYMVPEKEKKRKCNRNRENLVFSSDHRPFSGPPKFYEKTLSSRQLSRNGQYIVCVAKHWQAKEKKERKQTNNTTLHCMLHSITAIPYCFCFNKLGTHFLLKSYKIRSWLNNVSTVILSQHEK